MNSMENIERQMQRTHLIFKRQKNVMNKSRQLVSYAKTLSPDALALLLISFMSSLAPILTKAKLAQRLRESCEDEILWNEHFSPLVEELYEVEEDGESTDTVTGLSLRQLLSEVEEVKS